MTTSDQRVRRTVRMQPGPADTATPPVAPGPPAPSARPSRRQRAVEPPTAPPGPQPDSSGALPPFGLVVARPLLLLVCALLGAITGFLASGNAGYQAQAMLQFSTQSLDSVVVKQTGQTLARRVLAADIVSAAENATVFFDEDAIARWAKDPELTIRGLAESAVDLVQVGDICVG